MKWLCSIGIRVLRGLFASLLCQHIVVNCFSVDLSRFTHKSMVVQITYNSLLCYESLVELEFFPLHQGFLFVSYILEYREGKQIEKKAERPILF